jgi:hypothetical protein
MTTETLERPISADSNEQKNLRTFNAHVEYITTLGTPKTADLEIEAATKDDADKQARNLIVHNGQRRCDTITSVKVEPQQKRSYTRRAPTGQNQGNNKSESSAFNFAPLAVAAGAVAAMAVGAKRMFFGEPASR